MRSDKHKNIFARLTIPVFERLERVCEEWPTGQILGSHCARKQAFIRAAIIAFMDQHEDGKTK